MKNSEKDKIISWNQFFALSLSGIWWGGVGAALIAQRTELEEGNKEKGEGNKELEEGNKELGEGNKELEEGNKEKEEGNKEKGEGL
ncbi:MAG: hypothetical protein J5506_09210 [Prevotella sp.]|nr:hypothetical protein [Prevotella sp.]